MTVVLAEAVLRARGGGGPTLVEADTYRMQAHTNADDSTRYRSDDEVELWRARDPLLRLRAHLEATGVLTPEGEARITEEAEVMAAHVRSGMAREATTDPLELFAHVLSRPTPQLAEQAAALAAELAYEDGVS